MYNPPTFHYNEVLVYLRKSRSDDPALSVEEVLSKHEHILNEYSEKHLGGLVPPAQVYKEVASSETLDGRPEMLRLLRDIENPRIKAVLVVEVQRLSRGDLEDAGRLMKLLRFTNTMVITPTHTYNLDDEYDRDSFERELKRGNEYLEYSKKIQARGRLQSVKEGCYIPSIAPYGYNKTFLTIGKKKRPTLEPDPEQAPIVQLIFDLYVNQDMGAQRICSRLQSMGIPAPNGPYWNVPHIYHMLSNRHYIGKVVWNRRKTVTYIDNQSVRHSRPVAENYLVYDGLHPALIPDSLFEDAQKKLKRHAPKKRGTALRNPLAGLLYCTCGHVLQYRAYARSKPRYVCNYQHICNSGGVLVSDVLERLVHTLESEIENFRVKLCSGTDDTSAADAQLHIIEGLKKRIRELEAKEIAQWDAFTSGEMPKHIFDTLNDKVKNDLQTSRRGLACAMENMPEPVDYEERIATFTDVVNALTNPDISPEQKNTFLKGIILRIDYNREKPERLTREKAKENGLDVDGPGKIYWYAPPYDLEITFL